MLRAYVRADYPFAKYNTSSNVYSYTPEEYSDLLEGESHPFLWLPICSCSYADEEWTKEETDYLFSLVADHDTRFYVIADRYEFPGGPSRNLEVIYYLLSSIDKRELML
jgi:DNA methyltransferase 1-associated protein 1